MMINRSSLLAKHIRDVHSGGNWTCVNLKDTLDGISWEQAVRQVEDFNTVATLTYHIHYYITAVLAVFKGGSLNASDKLSFAHPPITCQADWDRMLADMWAETEAFAAIIARQPEHIWDKTFADEKYGTYYRNIQGIIEHTHYHLGQIALIKKMLLKAG